MLPSSSRLGGLILAAGFALAQSSSSSSSSSSPSSSSSSEPCAIVSTRVKRQISAGNTIAAVPAEDALACLDSVPLNITEAGLLIDELKLYLQWQSNIEYYSRPPDGYTEDQVDIEGSLDGIALNLANGTYTSEYDFQYDVSLAIKLAYDFHLTFSADILSQFIFLRGAPGEFALISISEDGKALPKAYNYYEVANGQSASAIVSVNGEPVNDYLDYWASFSTYHDQNARYNRLMYQPNQFAAVGDDVSDFSASLVLDEQFPRWTNLTFENGTEVSLHNFAIFATDEALNEFNNGIDDGQDFFDRLCNLPGGFPDTFVDSANAALKGQLRRRHARETTVDAITSTNTNTTARRDDISAPYIPDGNLKAYLKREMSSSSPPGPLEVSRRQRRQAQDPTTQSETPPVTQLEGFPKPVMITTDGIISGYYLSDPGYEDVAVLNVPSFSPATSADAIEFQDKIQSFLQQANADGRSRLVIDLRGNTGGRVFLGYDLFKQLFPSIEPYGATRFRANDAFNTAGLATSSRLEGFGFQDALQDFSTGKYDFTIYFAWRSMFNYRLNLDEGLKPFESWPDMFGPHEFNGDNFTALQRYNFEDAFADDTDIDVGGYGTRADVLGPQPFDAANVVLLQDGACGSTCAVFSEMAKAQGRIRQVVLGGRPVEGPMQGVAGSKGAEVMRLDDVFFEAYGAYNFLTDARDSLRDTEVGALANAFRPLQRSQWGKDGKPLSSINLRDNIRQGDEGQTPLEFVYEAADCRLFYTRDMVLNPVAAWRAAIDSRWNSTEACVAGSVGDKSSLSGGAEVAGSEVADAITEDAAAVKVLPGAIWAMASFAVFAMLI